MQKKEEYKMEKKWCVYEHLFPNGKRYIGITSKKPKCRWERGSGYKREGSPMWRAVLKYGWDNIEHNVLFEGLTQQEACAKEQELIAFYKTNITRYGSQYGYNLTDGGEGTLGHKVPQSLRDKTRERLLGKTGADCPNSRPVLCDGKEYASLTEFKEAFGNPKGNIGGWLLGRVGMPLEWYEKGLCYKDLGTDITYVNGISDKRNLRVCADDMVFDTLKECAEYLGSESSCLCLYLNNKQAPPAEIIKHNLRYENESEHNFKKKSPSKPGITKCECDGKIFSSQKELADYLGVKPATLSSYFQKNRMPQEYIDRGIKRIR